jgi:hypothetical protein
MLSIVVDRVKVVELETETQANSSISVAKARFDHFDV